VPSCRNRKNQQILRCTGGSSFEALGKSRLPRMVEARRRSAKAESKARSLLILRAPRKRASVQWDAQAEWAGMDRESRTPRCEGMRRMLRRGATGLLRWHQPGWAPQTAWTAMTQSGALDAQTALPSMTCGTDLPRAAKLPNLPSGQETRVSPTDSEAQTLSIADTDPATSYQ
jgi:hypothetical protein